MDTLASPWPLAQNVPVYLQTCVLAPGDQNFFKSFKSNSYCRKLLKMSLCMSLYIRFLVTNRTISFFYSAVRVSFFFCLNHNFFFSLDIIAQKYGGRESSMRCNFRKHMQIEKAPANQENIFINLTAGAANAHNTDKQIILFAACFFVWLCCEYLQCISLFGCVVSICSACVVKFTKLFS